MIIRRHPRRTTRNWMLWVTELKVIESWLKHFWTSQGFFSKSVETEVSIAAVIDLETF